MDFNLLEVFETLMNAQDFSSQENECTCVGQHFGHPLKPVRWKPWTSKALPQLTPTRLPHSHASSCTGPLHMLFQPRTCFPVCLGSSSSQSHPSLTAQIRLGGPARLASPALSISVLLTVVIKLFFTCLV